MPAANRSGVKRVEVVVVAAITLVGLAVLVVYLLNGREAARRNVCLHNQEQLAEAMQAYDGFHPGFPGYVNRLGSGEGEEFAEAGWVVVLLPFLDKEDLWKTWQGGEEKAVYLPSLVCPADPPLPEVRDSGPLAYVVNCGVVDESGDVNNGVCMKFKGVSLDYVENHDGAANTLLLSENIQAGRWTDTTIADVGMVAFEEPGPCSGINRCVDAGDRPQEIKYARPSSYHSGGVNAALCNGNVRFINQDIDYSVYRRLLDTGDEREW